MGKKKRKVDDLISTEEMNKKIIETSIEENNEEIIEPVIEDEVVEPVIEEEKIETPIKVVIEEKIKKTEENNPIGHANSKLLRRIGK